MLAFLHVWVLALLPLPWAVRRLPPRVAAPVAVRVPFGRRLRRAAAEVPAGTRTLHTARHWLADVLVWALVLVALARPQWIGEPLTRERPTRDLLLLADLSASMQEEDFTSADGRAIDRLTAVKKVVGEFLIRREGDRVGLVVFGSAPFLQAPFSTDLELSRRLLDETAIGMAGPRTALGDAIGLGIHLFESSDAPARTMIALTDGNDTDSQVPPVEAARVAHDRGIRVHTVAIGDPTTVGEEKLDEETLREIARTTGGSYFFAADRRDLERVYDELDRIETRKVDLVSHRPRRELFYWPLLVALLISICARVAGVPRGVRAGLAARPRRIRVHPRTGKLEATP